MWLVCVCQGQSEGALGVAAQPGGDKIRPLWEAQETEIWGQWNLLEIFDAVSFPKNTSEVFKNMKFFSNNKCVTCDMYDMFIFQRRLVLYK